MKRIFLSALTIAACSLPARADDTAVRLHVHPMRVPVPALKLLPAKIEVEASPRTTSAPAVSSIGPVMLLLPVRISVPEPSLVRVPAPVSVPVAIPLRPAAYVTVLVELWISNPPLWKPKVVVCWLKSVSVLPEIPRIPPFMSNSVVGPPMDPPSTPPKPQAKSGRH